MEDNIKVNCSYCNKEIEKIAKEYRRQVKKGNIFFYCNLSCSRLANNKKNKPKGNIRNLKVRTKDDYSPFRWFVLRCNYRGKRKRKFGCNLTKEYLKNLWALQNGICPITGCKLILPIGTQKSFENYNPYNASLDRIDNSIGYMQGNVRFISFMANIARQSFTDEQLIEFCKMVVANN